MVIVLQFYLAHSISIHATVQIGRSSEEKVNDINCDDRERQTEIQGLKLISYNEKEITESAERSRLESRARTKETKVGEQTGENEYSSIP